MSFLDLTKNNTDLKSYKYEIEDIKEKMHLKTLDWKEGTERMRYLRKKIRECESKKGYKMSKIGTIGFGRVLTDNKGCTVITDAIVSRGRYYGKPHITPITRALTYEEHQEILRQKREKHDEKN